MLHIISITEIKFKRLSRQILGMQAPEEDSPTVEETIDLVREMQAIRPQTPSSVDTQDPEVDYPSSDEDKPVRSMYTISPFKHNFIRILMFIYEYFDIDNISTWR